jgi:ubiquinol-cytochrome c reductase iron-sulfur subunit
MSGTVDGPLSPRTGRPPEGTPYEQGGALDPAQRVNDDLVQRPVDDPGLPPHEHRHTDVDPAMERRAERQVAGMFGLSALATILFVVAYFALDETDTIAGIGAQNAALGLTLGIALFAIGAAAIQWAKKLMPDVELVEERKPMRSAPEDRTALVEVFNAGVAGSGFGRRSLIRGSMLASLGLLGLPAVVLLRDLGPNPEGRQAKTLWRSGDRVLNDVTYLPLRAADIPVGTLVNAMPASFEELPEGSVERLNARAHSPVIVVRMASDEIRSQQGDNWDYGGIMAFSKICTHIGCPINLYERRTHHLLCPCHQSTFDLADGARVIFGPAGRPLPQLPLDIDDEGYLIASAPFQEAVGPSYWERG